MLITDSDSYSAIEMRHLRALVAVGRTSSFSRAANELGYAQSAVSQQIAALERIVGVALVERPGGPRPVSLTPQGQVLVRHAERMLARLAVARGDLLALAAGEAGTLRIGTFQSAGAQLLPEAVRRFRADLPAVEIRLLEDQNETVLLDAVLAGELDLAFALVHDLDPRFESLELVRDPWVLLAPRDSELADHQPVPLARLHGLQMVEWQTSTQVYDVEAQLARFGINIDVIFRTDDNLTLQHFVGAGLGHAIAGRLVVEPGSSDMTPLVLRLAEGIDARRIGVVWARDRTRTRAAEAFVETARVVALERFSEQAP
jgi:DNA-binding transcriptional LysR family regulator